MDETNALSCQVIRVTRPNTLLIRVMNPALQSMVSTYLVLHGVRCQPLAAREIIDWLEIHGDFQRFRLRVCDWVRDSFGRLLGDICDRRSGECLTDYLLQRGVATVRERHLEKVMIDLLNAQEPEDL